MPCGSVVNRHGPPPSQQWEGIAQDERPPGETFDESSLRRAQPYVHPRGSTASMALEQLPPTCVAGRGDGVRRGDVGSDATAADGRTALLAVAPQPATRVGALPSAAQLAASPVLATELPTFRPPATADRIASECVMSAVCWTALLGLAGEAQEEWLTSACLAAQDVQGLGAGDYARVSPSALTRTIEVRCDFGQQGCSVHGPHPGRARAAFYTAVAVLLATYARKCSGQGDVWFIELTLERATDIMSEVATIRAVEGVEDSDVLARIADAHGALDDAAEVVSLLRARPKLVEHRAMVKKAATAAAVAKSSAREIARAAAATCEKDAAFERQAVKWREARAAAATAAREEDAANARRAVERREARDAAATAAREKEAAATAAKAKSAAREIA